MSVNDTPSGLITKPEKFSYIEATKADIQTIATTSTTTDTLTLPTGASNGDVLTSDASGNATWQPIPVSVPSTDVTGFGFTDAPNWLTDTVNIVREGNHIRYHVSGAWDPGFTTPIPPGGQNTLGTITLPAGYTYRQSSGAFEPIFIASGFTDPNWPIYYIKIGGGAGSPFFQPLLSILLTNPGNSLGPIAGNSGVEFTLDFYVSPP